MSFDIWYVYIYFDIIHPCIYLSSALASRPELTEEDALALPASVAQVGNVSLEIQEIRTIGIQFWESVDLTKTCSFSMQLFYKLLLWREGCLLSSWKPSAASPADLWSILKHCIKLLKICLQPTGSAARFCDQFEITWPNGNAGFARLCRSTLPHPATGRSNGRLRAPLFSWYSNRLSKSVKHSSSFNFSQLEHGDWVRDTGTWWWHWMRQGKARMCMQHDSGCLQTIQLCQTLNDLAACITKHVCALFLQQFATFPFTRMRWSRQCAWHLFPLASG